MGIHLKAWKWTCFTKLQFYLFYRLCSVESHWIPTSVLEFNVSCLEVCHCHPLSIILDENFAGSGWKSTSSWTPPGQPLWQAPFFRGGFLHRPARKKVMCKNVDLNQCMNFLKHVPTISCHFRQMFIPYLIQVESSIYFTAHYLE